MAVPRESPDLPDAVVTLDGTARRLVARGVLDLAAELLELALNLGGSKDFLLRAAHLYLHAGDPRRAQMLLEHAIPALPRGPVRARVLVLLAEIHFYSGSYPAARNVLDQARPEADARLAVMIDLRLSFAHFTIGAPADVAARSALERARGLGDPHLHGLALAVAAMADFCLGRGADNERLDKADELAQSCRRCTVPLITTWLRGNPFPVELLGFGPGCLGGTGRFPPTDSGSALELTADALADAYAGRVDEARSAGEKAIAQFERAGWQTAAGWALTALGFADLSAGDHAAAAARLGSRASCGVTTGIVEPANGWLFTADAAEALIMTGRLRAAEPIVRWLEERGVELDRAWAIGAGARCRGLLLAARGELTSAEQAIARAMAAHERFPKPVERARSLLVLGRICQLRRKPKAARAAFEEALAGFEAAGSPRWAEQASAEIARLGRRPREADELTSSEQRVARLAASGLTNREVAASLMVSPKTVEAHLTRIYRKIGIHRRAELGAHMARQTAKSALSDEVRD